MMRKYIYPLHCLRLLDGCHPALELLSYFLISIRISKPEIIIIMLVNIFTIASFLAASAVARSIAVPAVENSSQIVKRAEGIHLVNCQSYFVVLVCIMFLIIFIQITDVIVRE